MHEIRALQKLGAMICVIAVSGCAMTTQQLMQEVMSVRNMCDAKLEVGVYKTFYERTECFNDGLMVAYVNNNYPYIDLVILANAYRLAVAERVDKGELTKTEAQVLMAELGNGIATEEQKRTNDAVYARAAQAQGTGALLQGIGSLNQSMQPLQRQPIVCTHTGITTVCN